MDITVLEGARWEASRSYIVEPFQLTKMISDNSYMTVDRCELEGDLLNLRLNSNNLDKLKLHVFGYTFFSALGSDSHMTMRKMCPHYLRETFGIPYVENSFFNEKVLSDEMSYVLNRKQKNAYMGNTLEKPPILLKRHFNRDTITNEENLQQERDFGERNLANNQNATFNAERKRLSMPPVRTHRFSRVGEFLGKEGLILTNITPDENGDFKLQIPGISELTHLRIIASDVLSNYYSYF